LNHPSKCDTLQKTAQIRYQTVKIFLKQNETEKTATDVEIEWQSFNVNKFVTLWFLSILKISKLQFPKNFPLKKGLLKKSASSLK
jgi:hypothetical protein